MTAIYDHACVVHAYMHIYRHGMRRRECEELKMKEERKRKGAMHVRRARAPKVLIDVIALTMRRRLVPMHVVVRHGVFDKKYRLHTHLNLNEPTYIHYQKQ